jgi:ribosomal protein S18 acetylase RimI-like enzyme
MTQPELVIQHIPSGPKRDRCIPLLLLADEAEQQVRGYYQGGELYALHESESDGNRAPVGVVLALPIETDTVELKAVAIAPDWQNRGAGKQLLADVMTDLRRRGVRRVIVGTSNAGIGQLAFYQKAGFRLWRIERDVFNPERGYDPATRENGIAHRDMVWFDREL